MDGCWRGMGQKLAGGKTVEGTLPGCEHPLVIACILEDRGGSKVSTLSYFSCIAMERMVEKAFSRLASWFAIPA